MTTIKGMNQSINYFFRKIGFTDVHAEYKFNDFAYVITLDDSRKVWYSFNTDEDLMAGFNAYLDINYPNRPKCTDFVFGLLHELGHHVTLDISNEKYHEDEKRKKEITEEIQNKQLTKKEAQIKYCGLYVEAIATKEAIKLLENNYLEIQKFEKRFKKLMEKA